MATKQSTKKVATKKSATRKSVATKKTTVKKPASKKSAVVATDLKLSAINAAAKVLNESKEPLTAKQMIEQMAAKKYLTSPGGKTPHATLYAAILRDIQCKGDDSRFVKADRGHFMLNE